LVLTEEGQHVLEHGSHEAAVYNAIPANSLGASQVDLLAKVPYAKVGIHKAIVRSWVDLIIVNDTNHFRKRVPSSVDDIQNNLKELERLSDDSIREYSKRKFIKLK
jgi:phenylalanyl-tRNA synthetase alpha chain